MRWSFIKVGRQKRVEKGSALIAVVVGMLVFGSLGTTMISLTSNNLASSTEDLQGSQAFYVAEGGMQWVLMNQLAGDTNFSDNPPPTDPPFGPNAISLNPGQFWVEYINPQPNQTAVRVTSRVGTAIRVVEQQVGQSGSGRQYVTMAGGNIVINSSTGDLFGDVGLEGNANIDPDVTVHGNIYQDPSLELPTLDFNVYRNMCTSTYNGNLTISSSMSGDLCVTGNVTIRSNVTYTGLLYTGSNISINGNNVIINGTLMAEGNIAGDTRCGLRFISQSRAPNQHMPAIAARGNISLKMDPGLRVEGVAWADGNVDLTNSHNLNYRGSFMVGGNMAINSTNNLALTFDADLLVGVPGLSGGGGSSTGSLSLSGWKTYAPWW